MLINSLLKGMSIKEKTAEMLSFLFIFTGEHIWLALISLQVFIV